MLVCSSKRTRYENEEVVNIFDESCIGEDESGMNSDNINVAKLHPAFHYEGDNANHQILEGGKVLFSTLVKRPDNIPPYREYLAREMSTTEQFCTICNHHIKVPGNNSPCTLAQFGIADISTALTQMSADPNSTSPATFHLAQHLTDMLLKATTALDPEHQPQRAHTSVPSPFIKDNSLIPMHALSTPLHTLPLPIISPATVANPHLQAAYVPSVPPFPTALESPQIDAQSQFLPDHIVSSNPSPQIDVSSQSNPDSVSLNSSRHSSRRPVPNPRYVANAVSTSQSILQEAETHFINLVEAVHSAQLESPPSYGVAVLGADSDKWIAGFEAEIHRLVKKTKTGRFVSAREIPLHQSVA